MLNIKIKPERNNFILPNKGTNEAACYDCYISAIEQQDDGLIICYLGFSQEIPKGWKALIHPRSSIRKYGWIMCNSVGVIDSDYRGELQASFRCLREIGVSVDGTYHNPVFPYTIGDRVCQISWEKVNDIEFTIVDNINETARTGGHGSTGI